MLYSVESHKPLDRLAADLEAAVTRHKFGVIGVLDLKKKMAEKGVTFDAECRIFDVCNPNRAKEVLEKNLEVSTALPCRISLFQEKGKAKLAMIKPTALIGLFTSPELKDMAAGVEAELIEMMDEAAG